jgi:glycosyltransferase involved in cell wall biosynthesis
LIKFCTEHPVHKKILINGAFFCRRLTGIERYACEITRRLDKISKPGEIAIFVPNNARNIPAFSNLTVIRHKKNIKSHFFWQMLTLQWYLLTHRHYTVLDFGNTCLPFAPGIVFLHDIYCELFPKDFTTGRDILIRAYNRWQYRLISRRAKKIVTVSYFTRNQIVEKYGVDAKKISVVYSSWEHYKSLQTDNSVFNDYPNLKGNYYFYLGSLSKRKNLKWIFEYARKNHNSIFAISGISLSVLGIDKETASVPPNIILLGYLDDSKVKALMKKCKAFILPSYYEGFGLTPLEALSCGSPIIVANAASLPEIYGNTAHYIDPFNTNIDLDQLLLEPVEKPDEILKKYSYDTAARQTYQIIQEYSGR